MNLNKEIILKEVEGKVLRFWYTLYAVNCMKEREEKLEDFVCLVSNDVHGSCLTKLQTLLSPWL